MNVRTDMPGTAVVAKPLRLRHVDSLRAIAAGLVVWTHFAETLYPLTTGDPAALAFLHTLPPALVMGRLGVDLFFAISGFVICRSFGAVAAGATRRFVIRRFCRLYPAFWLSIGAGVVMWQLDGYVPPLPMLVANATMVPITLGQPMLIGLYWTLNIELIFYALCLLLHWLGRLEHRGALVLCAAACAGARRSLHLIGHFTGGNLDLPPEGGVWMMSLALMFWGALFRSVYEETHGFRRLPFGYRSLWLLLGVTVALLDLNDPRLKMLLFQSAAGPLGERLVTLHAVVFFTVWVALLRVETQLLTFIGVVSYSLYLFHPLVLSIFAATLRSVDESSRPDWPFWAYLGVGTVLSITLANAIYRWVEHPAIAFGKRWSARVPEVES